MVFVLLCVKKFRRSGIQSNGHILSRFQTGLFNGFQHHLNGFFVGFQIGGETAFITHIGGLSAVFQHPLQGVEHFRPPTQGFAETGSAYGHNHELLEINGIVRMFSAIEDVHHRNGQPMGMNAAQIAEQLYTVLLRSRFGTSQGYAQNGVGAEVPLVFRAVQLNHTCIDNVLTVYGIAIQFLRNGLVDGLHRLQHALSFVQTLIVIP